MQISHLIALGTVSLSWWEDGKQLEAVGRNISTSLTLTLRVTDSGRRFTCQDSVTQTQKSVKLHVVERKSFRQLCKIIY